MTCYDCNRSTTGTCPRHRFFLVALTCLFLAGLAVVAAQALAAPPDAGIAASAPAVATAPPAPACDLPCELGKLRTAYDSLKASGSGAPGAKHFAIAALVAVVLRLLMQGLEKILGWDRLEAKRKRWIPLILLGLGALTAVATRYGAGESWPMALLYGATGPGAVFANEAMNLWPSKKAPPKRVGP